MESDANEKKTTFNVVLGAKTRVKTFFMSKSKMKARKLWNAL